MQVCQLYPAVQLVQRQRQRQRQRVPGCVQELAALALLLMPAGARCLLPCNAQVAQRLCFLPLQVNLWWLLLCFAESSYVCWMREQRAREAFARRLGDAGQAHLRHLRRGHPMYRWACMLQVLLAGDAELAS